MTTVIILVIGFGTVLMISAFETDPATGQDVSVMKTIGDVWNNNVTIGKPAASSAGSAQTAPLPPATGTGTSFTMRDSGVQHWIATRYQLG